MAWKNITKFMIGSEWKDGKGSKGPKGTSTLSVIVKKKGLTQIQQIVNILLILGGRYKGICLISLCNFLYLRHFPNK